MIEVVERPRRKRSRASKSPSKARKVVGAPKSISKLTKEFDTVFSRWVRMSAMNEGEMVRCYTCDHVAHYKKIHAGHYISRWYKSTRWEPNNVRPQCFMCNIYKKGNSVVFREKLIQEIGREKVEEMEEKTVRNWVMGKLSREDLEERISYFKGLLENI